MTKTLFLDRDGVINIDHGYIYQAEKFEFITGVFDACQRFQQAGYQIVIVTNQSGIGRGYYTEQDFQRLTKWMLAEFSNHGIEVLDVMYCPHHPEKAMAKYLTKCDCRKPEPGMLLQAINEYNIDPKTSIMVGDKASDIQAAINAGLGQKYLVSSGKKLSEQGLKLADACYVDLADVADQVLGLD